MLIGYARVFDQRSGNRRSGGGFEGGRLIAFDRCVEQVAWLEVKLPADGDRQCNLAFAGECHSLLFLTLLFEDSSLYGQGSRRRWPQEAERKA